MGDTSVILPAPVPQQATEHMVRMRDGTRLATDVYLPPGGAPTATVLVRLCYDKDGRYTFMPQLAPRVTGRGYAFVVQDVRGKFRSEGTTLAFVHEARDGYDTLEWISRQQWSDGKVGMFGDSYYGFTQWAAVSSGHPALRAIVPRVTSANLGMINAGRSERKGDVGDVDWLVSAAYLSHYWLDNFIHEYENDYSLRPLVEIFEEGFRRVGARSASFDMLIPRGVPAPSYPDGHPFDARPVPVLHVVGWFDNLVIAHMRDYEELASRPAWALAQYLIADSTDHENYHLSLAPVGPENDHDSNDEALESMLALYLDPALEFFDVFLKELRGPEAIPRVRWHLGHVGYRESSAWPPPGSSELSLYLGELVNANKSSGRLSESLPADEEDVSWTHDPDDLIPSAVENSFAFLHSYPDEGPLGDRDDVLVFTTDERREPLDMTGPVRLFVRVSSDAPTTDVYAKVLDVAPDGSARMIVRGQGHLRAPSPSRLAEIELGHTGYRLRPGHRLRLHIASSDYPEYVPHPGSDDDPWLTTTWRESRQTLHTGPDSPARILLTVSEPL